MNAREKRMAKVKEEEKQEPLAVGRHTGEHIWGYQVFDDGTVQLSPGFADRFRSIHDAETGLYQMHEAVTKYVSSELARLAKHKREWWKELRADLAFDPDQNWTFDVNTGCVRPPKEEPAADQSGGTDRE
jgi:hypothetical protein